MALDYGSGVSRTLSPQDRAWASVIWRKGRPPLDAELNLMTASDMERMRLYVTSLMPSGFLMDPTRSQRDFHFNKLWANHFHFGVSRDSTGSLDEDETQPVVWANINGWIIPVAGTDVDGVHNVVRLYPPPGSDARIDFVFLEAWACIVRPNPSTVNKPTASTIWKYGNVKFGGSNLVDDIEDPTVGYETTKRVQIQYRIRVYGSGLGGGNSVNLAVHPDGFGDPNILGQGANKASPVAGMLWENMREELGDSSLWRAGNGDPNNDLGTIDGYTYAIPICAVFRRSIQTYVAVMQSGNPTQNGAAVRTPGTYTLIDPLDGAVPLLQASLGESLGPNDGKVAAHIVAVTNLNGCGLEDPAHVLSNVFLRIGTEIVGISSVNLVDGTITIPAGGRGRWGTATVGHAAGTLISQFNTRPDGQYADEISSSNVLDLRRAVNPGDWDYNRLLAHNVSALVQGTLRTAWKESNPGDTEGPVVHDVAELFGGSDAHPNHTDAVDGPDGIRTIWSDAAVLQPDVTMQLKYDATRDASGLVGFTNPGFDVGVQWDVGAGFNPVGFQNTGGGDAGWYNGSSVHLFIGGVSGEQGARGTFRASGVRDVRFVTPQEQWKSGYPIVDPRNGNQTPITIRFEGEKLTTAPPTALPESIRSKYPGPMYPWRETRFERPFIVLGGLLASGLRAEAVNVSNLSVAADIHGQTRFFLDLTDKGFDFNLDGDWLTVVNGIIQDDVDYVGRKLLRESRTFYGMLTNGGRDITGASSEVYLVTFGDPSGRNNNGAFRVIGAGTVGYTRHSAPNAGSLVLEPLSADFSGWNASGNSITVDFRSQWHNADDVSVYDVASRTADLVVVLTDIGGEGLNGGPWDQAKLPSNLHLAQSGGAGPYYAPSNMVLSTTLLYHPGRAATARVPDDIVRFAMRGGSEETLGTYLRRSPSSIDTSFSAIGTATDETYWPPVQIQTWNRLSGLGSHAPEAPSYGGSVVGFTEQDRESECFVDRGSKTVVFRPFRNRDMTLHAVTWGNTELSPGTCLLGSYTYPDATNKDPIQILTGGSGDAGKRMGFKVPREFMPRFGRQDIPYRRLNSGATPSSAGFMPGINHLFTDVTDVTNPVFNLIGGERNAGGSEVNSLFLVTRSSQIAYAKANPSYGPKNVGAYGARKTTSLDPSAGQNTRDIINALAAVNSSDIGRGLKGIQMPPYMGIARLYGVYEYEDYMEKGGTSFAANRYELDVNSAVNLLREDVDQQTLFILQNGAKDLTTEAGDHTYIIPSNVLDLTRIPADPGNAHNGYVEDVSVFGDFDYVVECTVFFFAKGFIDENNVVLPREYSGTHTQIVDGTNPVLENVPMCIPSPAGVNDRFYLAYNRTVYQGDPYMTRAGSSRQVTDYAHRYGRLTPAQSQLLRTAVQQFDSTGNFVPQMSNPRAFEVLASMDFYTTLGTGKIGGALFPGTPLDIGHIESSDLASTRMPLNSKDWRVSVRAFTEGQKKNTNRAGLTLTILDADSLRWANEHGEAFTVFVTTLDGSVYPFYGLTSGRLAAWVNTIPDGQSDLVTGQGDFFPILDRDESIRLDYSAVDLFDGVTLTPTASTFVVTLPKATWDPQDLFSTYGNTIVPHVQAKAAHTDSNGSVVFMIRADSNGDLILTAVWTGSYYQFNSHADNSIFDSTWSGFGAVAAGSESTSTTQLAVSGLLLTDTVIVQHTGDTNPSASEARLLYIPHIPSNGILRMRAVNPTSGAITPGDVNLQIIVLRDATPSNISYAFGDGADFDIRVSQIRPDRSATAAILANAINGNVNLSRTVTAHALADTVFLTAVATGAEGNGVRVAMRKVRNSSVGNLVPGAPLPSPLEYVLRMSAPYSNDLLVGHYTTASNLVGGVDLPVNAGNGTSQVALTGMTERLPLGVLVQDSDFLCENPLGDVASAMRSFPAPIRPVQSLVPLTNGGEEFSRFLGSPGELFALVDVQIAPYSWAAWTDTAPDGATRKFRIYRGGGAAFVLSGSNPGGPLEWVSESLPRSSQPVLKGGILACRAMLVRNYYEEAFSGGSLATPSSGDEVQLVILTHAHLGDGRSVEDGVALSGIISPSGYGEGYSAADRYRCMGRPMVRGYSRATPNPNEVVLAVYPEDQRDK